MHEIGILTFKHIYNNVNQLLKQRIDQNNQCRMGLIFATKIQFELLD